MKYKVVITCPIFVDMEPVWQMARDTGIELVVEDKGVVQSVGDYIEVLRDADAALVATTPPTSSEVLSECPRLKAVSRMGVGVDSIDLEAATELGILVCNVPGENTGEVAEHAVALLLAVLRKIPQSIAGTRRGDWAGDKGFVRRMQTTVDRVAGNTVGILGLGNIGRAFAMRIRGFGPRHILAHDAFISQAQADLIGVEMVELDELLARSDFFTIHAPHTPATDKIINAATLAKMKPTAILINCSRGGLVDQPALTAALQNNVIAYAALDVTSQEPIASDDPLLTLPNAFITPHTAGFSPTFLAECCRKQAENVTRALTGLPPHGIANPAVIKRIAVMRIAESSRWDGVPEL